MSANPAHKQPIIFHDFSAFGSKAEASWISKCQMENGKPVCNLANVLVALRCDPVFVDAIVWDEMQQSAILMKPLDGDPSFEPKPLTDKHVSKIQEMLQLAGLKRVGRDIVHSAVDQRAYECAFHPILEYFDSLKWDGTKRINSWLTSYLGATATDYTAGVGKMFLISMVARISNPGCKADHMLVLEGSQGTKKSTACAVLGGKWFSDSLPDVTGGKDVSQHLAGKWVIEIAEMSAMSKVESAHLKAFITRNVEKYRPPYGRKDVVQPRQCVFIGTTNNPAYLRDETGGRRFWPVKVGVIDIDALVEDRDQLFAEAQECLLLGEKWHPDAQFEMEVIRPEQDDRYEPDGWEMTVREYVEGRDKVLIGQILQEALGIEVPGRDRAKQIRVVAILIRLGWVRLKKDSKGYYPWGPPNG